MGKVTLTAAVEAVYKEVLGGQIRASTQLAAEPIKGTPELQAMLIGQAADIELFFQATIRIARSALAGSKYQSLVGLLFSELPDHLGVNYHRALGDALWTAPSFYRTDQSTDGLIYEIQCPGSGWGDFELLGRAYSRLGIDAPQALGFGGRFVAQVKALTGKDRPTVLHLLDNASVPWGMRLFIETTRPGIQYWGYDTDVPPLEIDLVRSHSFYGLAAENLFSTRLAQATAGDTRFDLPGHVLFDQKAAQVLPYLAETRDEFPESIRSMFPYTALAGALGFVDKSGEYVSWEDFLARPSAGRAYFLKYGGPDVSKNWGSRAVFTLKGHDATALIERARTETGKGAVWLIQEAKSNREAVTYWDDETGAENTEDRFSKLSGFYGPQGFIGAKAMYRQHFKVHGQKQTAAGIVEF